MKQYLLAVHHPEITPDTMPPQAEMEKAYAAVEAFNQELQAKGAWVFAGGLYPPSSATVVRIEKGEPLFTDGPFSESKEQLGGFWIIQANDLDAALQWAAKGAAACGGPVEVRPFQDT